jgi:hypothetical protein
MHIVYKQVSLWQEHQNIIVYVTSERSMQGERDYYY